MPLFKSLLCLRGYDNGRRFLVISLSCYLLFLIALPLLSKAIVLFILLLLITSPILASSAIRRIHDAGFATPLAAIPVAIYWLCTIVITNNETAPSYALLILAFVATLATTTVSNARKPRNRGYQWGYWGPCLQPDDDENSDRGFYDRIEPTIAGKQNDPMEDGVTSAYIQSNLSQPSPPQTKSESLAQPDSQQKSKNYLRGSTNSWQKFCWEWINSNKSMSISLSVLLVIVVILVALWPYGEVNDDKPDVESNQRPEITQKQRLNKLSLPDKFWLMLDENEALTIAWQGDELDDGEVWSPITAKGDKDCFVIIFHGGENYRTMHVTSKNSGDYYADFSPVDTRDIVRSIALKSRFNLCGFEFSLKGTQGILMTNKKYASYFDDNR